jgi:TolA-binding protein
MLFTAGILAAALLAPQQGEGSAALQKDAQFALALTQQLGFDNFSEIVLEDALKRATTAEDRSALLLARCQVLETVAQRPIKPEIQVAAWGKAGQAYMDFLASNPTEAQSRKAQLQLGFVGFQFGEKLVHWFEQSPPSDEFRAEKVAEAEAMFTQSLRSVNKLISWWGQIDDPDVQAGARYSTLFPASFARALTYHYWGVLYPEGSVEREDNIARSLEFLEDFAISAGELSAAGLLAYKHMADGYVAIGDYEMADELYGFVIDEGVPAGTASEMPPGELKRRQNAQQDSFLGRVQLMKRSGASQLIPALAATFQQWVADNRVSVNDAGWHLLLELAEQQINDGNFGDAIPLLQSIADANKEKLLRLEADQMLGIAIAAAPPGVRINLDVLFQAGQGAYYSKDYQAATNNLKLLVGRLDGGTQANKLGGQAYYFLGRALEDDGLTLEAAVAYKSGYQNFPDDEETAEKLASRWNKLADRFRSSAPGDTYLDTFFNDSLDALQEATGGGAPHVVLLRAATSDYSLAKDLARKARGKDADSAEAKAAITAYDKAIASYRRIETGTESYEKAYVQIGMCEFNKFAWDGTAADRAVVIFNEYLNSIVTDPNNTPSTPKGKKQRTDAMARADFYRGRAYRNMAAAGDLSAWEEMIAAYQGFESRHPEQADQIGAVKTYRTEACLSLHDPAGAISEYEALVTIGASSTWLNACSFKLYMYYLSQITDQTEGEELLALQRSAVKYLQVANAQDARPKWQNLLSEARLHVAIGDLASGAKVYENTLQRFGPKEGFSEVSRFYAEVELVEAYLQQGKTGAAVPIMDKLLEEKPKNLRVKSMAIKIKCGFPVVSEGRIALVPGEDTLEAYQTSLGLISDLLQLAEATAKKNDLSKFESPEWWDAKVQHAFLLYKWSKLDSNKTHKKLLASLKRLAPDFGTGITGIEVPMILRWLETQS